ncbi:hypothetical protein [Rhodococcus phage REQ1]|nr:hypothetical protein RoPhREQ1_gp55 [Rhodococcus phage REQ1]AEV52051.1 hypothetical protein [Rhodococcus phage REQ1]
MPENKIQAILAALRETGIPADENDVEEFLEHLDDEGFYVSRTGE